MFKDFSVATQLQKSMQLEPKAYKCVAEDWDVKQDEWYHSLISIEDLPKILAILDLKIYAWCRCKVVASDKSEDHTYIAMDWCTSLK